MDGDHPTPCAWENHLHFLTQRTGSVGKARPNGRPPTAKWEIRHNWSSSTPPGIRTSRNVMKTWVFSTVRILPSPPNHAQPHLPSPAPSHLPPPRLPFRRPVSPVPGTWRAPAAASPARRLGASWRRAEDPVPAPPPERRSGGR